MQPLPWCIRKRGKWVFVIFKNTRGAAFLGTIVICHKQPRNHISFVSFCFVVRLLEERQFTPVIRIDETQILPSGYCHAGVARLAGVRMFMQQYLDTAILIRVFAKNRRTAVRRAVVHADDLNVPQSLVYDGIKTLPKVCFYIVYRDYYRDINHGTQGNNEMSGLTLEDSGRHDKPPFDHMLRAVRLKHHKQRA